MTRATQQAGFTLLEVIVALLLIATTGMALLSWINTHLISLQRVQAAQERQDALRNALAWLDTINPETQPQGEADIGIYQMSWTSKPLETAIRGINKWGNEGVYNLSLYETRVEVRQGSAQLAQFSVRLVGYEQVQFFSDMPF